NNQFALVDRVYAEVCKAKNVKAIPHLVGTMIEIPRACVVADKLAETAQFFSFGTNDLTQMSFGFSRDDTGSFMGGYIEKGILSDDPFQTIDQEGVGALMRMGVERGRKTRKDLTAREFDRQSPLTMASEARRGILVQSRFCGPSRPGGYQ
ncbi:MAG: hypothetical protein HGB21_16000, partial [Nitrospirae bacterium]|nr:hypothetical protein [Nitrospirota bacterium]